MTARVCILRQSYFPGDTHVRKNVDTLLDAGYEVDVICLREPGESASARYRDCRVTRLPLAHRRSGALRYGFEYLAFCLMTWPVLTWLQIRRRYRTIEVYNPPDFLIFAALPARLLGARLVFFMFEVMPEQAAEQLGVRESHPVPAMLRFLRRRAAEFAHRVVTVSPYDARLLNGCTLKRPVLVLPNTPPQGLFEPAAAEPGGDGGHWRLFTHGSLLRRYGIETLIRALPAIRGEVPKAHLTILGAGEDLPRLEAIAASLAVEDSVDFQPWIPFEDVPAAVAGADLCLVPVDVPWLLPNKIFEYAAMQKPILAAFSPSITEVFGSAVATFAAGDTEALAAAAVNLYNDPERCAQLGRAARQVYLTHEWRSTSKDYLRMHADLITAEGRRLGAEDAARPLHNTQPGTRTTHIDRSD